MGAGDRRTRGPGRIRTINLARICGRSFLLIVPALLSLDSACGQDIETQANEWLGSGSVITVMVHEPTGEPISSPALVKLFRGIAPSGQRETSRGMAEFVVTRFGEFTVVVSAKGYAEVQKNVNVDVAGRAQVDVYLRGNSNDAGARGVPGRPVLTPRANEALDKGLRALKENKLGEAEKYLGEALRLAPGNPDVLYIEGVLRLKQQNWKQAQTVLEKATQLDPSSARAFAALGMALCDEGKYEAAIGPLTKSMGLEPAARWETQWALAKSYYHLGRYDEALKLSQESLGKSNGGAPEIALLLAQSLTAVERYEDAAQVLRDFVRDYGNRADASTARRWLEQLRDSGKIAAK